MRRMYSKKQIEAIAEAVAGIVAEQKITEKVGSEFPIPTIELTDYSQETLSNSYKHHLKIKFPNGYVPQFLVYGNNDDESHAFSTGISFDDADAGSMALADDDGLVRAEVNAGLAESYLEFEWEDQNDYPTFASIDEFYSLKAVWMIISYYIEL